jgi:hypothetical protein
MNLEKYVYTVDETFTRFEFDSHGPKGTIKKSVQYAEMPRLESDIPMFNLGFGDWDDNVEKIDDRRTSGNADRDKVLATVANTALDLTNRLGNVFIHAKGSTPARTRLYQMSINANLEEIECLFDIYGFTSERWEKFKLGINYSAFLARRKVVI